MKYDKEELIKMIMDYQNKLDHSIMQKDISNEKCGFSMKHIKDIWSNLNNMKKELGLSINLENMKIRSKTKEEMVEDIVSFYNKNKRVPNSYDFGNDMLLSKNCYNDKFGSISKAIHIAGFVPNKKSISIKLTNEEIIEIYKETIIELGYVPSFDFCKTVYKLPSPRTVLRRLGCTWNEFIINLGYKPNENIATANPCKANDGTICFSSSECYIHNLLLNKNIKINKETYYRDIVNNKNLKEKCGYKRLDWTFEYKEKVYLVEYFGVMSDKNYKQRHDEKLEILKLDNQLDNLIAIYPKDLKRINDIFSFLSDI